MDPNALTPELSDNRILRTTTDDEGPYGKRHKGL
jgi:hypothetical protein